MSWEAFIKSRFASWVLSGVLILVMLFAGRVIVRKYQVDKEIAKLQQQVDTIKKNNDQLSYLIQYFNTPDYQEKQAREKLNLKKDGENVVALPDTSGASDNQVEAQSVSNAKQWFNYFFSK